MILKRKLMLDHSFSLRFWICAQRVKSTDAFARTAKQRQNLQLTLSRLIPADPRSANAMAAKKVNINKSYGCKKGGLPDCPKKNDLFCKDGTQMTANTILKYWGTAVLQRWRSSNGSFKSCVCPDGIQP